MQESSEGSSLCRFATDSTMMMLLSKANLIRCERRPTQLLVLGCLYKVLVTSAIVYLTTQPMTALNMCIHHLDGIHRAQMKYTNIAILALPGEDSALSQNQWQHC